MTERDQFLDEPVHDPLGSTIKLWRNRLGQRSDLGNAHEEPPSICESPMPPISTTFTMRQKNSDRQANFFRRCGNPSGRFCFLFPVRRVVGTGPAISTHVVLAGARSIL